MTSGPIQPSDLRCYVPRALLDMRETGERLRSVDSSLVFADVSGFTPLSERLARRGREGSEHLTDLLNELLGPALDLALDAGGDLLCFGGDALLIHLGGPRHRDLARGVGLGMSRRFHQAARRRRVRVGMSVGVASGTVHLHRVGRRFDLLVAHGPAVREVLRLESAAEAGEVLATDGLVHEEDEIELPIVLRDPPGTAFGHVIDPHVEVALRDGLGAEHRRSVVGFIRFAVDDRTAPLEEIDAELHELVDCVDRACEATEVTLLNFDVDPIGGKLILTAGVPFTTGDDPDRMLETTLRVRAGVAPGRDVRIGVNEGPLFAGAVGSPHRQAYTIMGDCVNLAARLAGRAAPGEVVAAAGVTQRARQALREEPIEPFSVKGKSHPILASKLVGFGTPNLGADHGLTSLRGRDEELARLVARTVESTRGHGSLVEIVAPPGTGKTRLVSELRDRTELPDLSIECGRYLASTAYGALAEALRGLIRAAVPDPSVSWRVALDEVVADRAPHLTEVVPILAIPFGETGEENRHTTDLSSEARRSRLQTAIAELMVALVDRPALLVIEDAHWMDEASAELLSSQTGRLTAEGWLVVVTRRPESTGWAPDAADLRLELGPLDEASALQLALDLSAQHPLPNHVMARLVERSHGNPLFLAQLVRSVSSGSALEDLPDRIETLIEAHLDRLPAGQRSALRAASVLGARFDPELLDAIRPGASEELANVGELVSSSEGEVRFRHALYRDTAYVALPVRQRRALHRAAAEAIERSAGDQREGVVELLAEHWDRAGEARRAWPFLRAAADRSQRDFAPQQALEFLLRARRTARWLDHEQRTELAGVDEQIGVLAETIGRYEDAERAFRRARRRVDRAEDVARLIGLEARVARSSRSLKVARQRYRRALALAPPEASHVRADLLIGLSSVLERQGRHGEKLPILEEALAHATTSGDHDVVAHTHLLLGNTLGDLGDPRAVDHFEQALALFESTNNVWGIASTQNNLGVEAYYAGDWEKSASHYLAAAEGYQRLGDETNHAMALNNLGEIHSDLGRYDAAAHAFTEARRMWRAVGFGLGVGLASSNLGRVAARQAHFEDAEAHFDEARRWFEQVDASGFLLELDARIAASRVAAGDAAGARDLVEATLARGDELQPTVRCQLLRTRALAAAALGAPTAARADLAEAAALAGSVGASHELLECEVVARDLDAMGDTDMLVS